MTPDQIAAWFAESLSELRAFPIEELEAIQYCSIDIRRKS